jgi:lipoate-protein ligase A
MLRRVAVGAAPESLRLYVPEDIVLFSSLDRRRPGFERAVELARAAGFETVIRLAGGHAAAFLSQSIAFAWAIPDPDPRASIRLRFERLAGIVTKALIRLGLDARVGELPGEYCPGQYSVNLGGVYKVMGVGQRVIRGGAHIGGVITVGQTDVLREMLIPIYEALELDFRSETAGGIADTLPGLGVEDVARAIGEILEEMGYELRPSDLELETLEVAATLEGHHHPGRSLASQGSLDPAGSKTLVQADRMLSNSPASSTDRD